MLVGAKEFVPSFAPFFLSLLLTKGWWAPSFSLFFSFFLCCCFLTPFFLIPSFSLFVCGCSINYKGLPMLFMWFFLLLVDDPSSRFSFFLFLCWFFLQKAWSLELLVCFFLFFCSCFWAPYSFFSFCCFHKAKELGSHQIFTYYYYYYFSFFPLVQRCYMFLQDFILFFIFSLLCIPSMILEIDWDGIKWRNIKFSHITVQKMWFNLHVFTIMYNAYTTKTW